MRALIGLKPCFHYLFSVQRKKMFGLLPLGLASMRIFKASWKKSLEAMFTMQATLMSYRTCLMIFWLKLAVSKLSTLIKWN